MPSPPHPTRALLLRHAESVANSSGDRFAPTSPQGDRLSERGLEQARAAASALRGCGATRLLCSPMGRARESAEPIAAALGLEADVLPDLHEVGEGDGEEGFEHILDRVRRLKAGLEARPGEVSLIVGHGIFTRYFAFDTLLGEAFVPQLAPAIWSLGSRNCGLSVFELGERPDPRDPLEVGWRCLSWMEQPWDRPR